ncbi:MAG: histidinol-phosphatase HisJ family protein [Clostridia bacterium]|nr:histidinol-phosphatase HisJ family protein [Clostridia bacterium]
MRNTNQMFCDLHTHSVYSVDAARDMTIENMCLSALHRGIGCLAVTDHYDIGFDYKFDPVSREEDFLSAKEKFAGRLDLLRGLELGEMMDGPEEADRIRSAVDYDVILGSVHGRLPGLDYHDLDYRQYEDDAIVRIWKDYLEAMTVLAENGDFDILAHIRYPERYVIRDGRGEVLDVEKKGCEMFEPVLRAIIRRDISLEINTAVVRKFGLQSDPGLSLLKFYRSIGGKHISIGSDAHRRNDLGANMRDALEMALAAGFEEISVFSGRKIRHISIEEGYRL